MANNWHQAELGRLFPNEIRQAADAVGAVNDKIADALGLIKTALELAAAIASLASQDPIEAALREALAQIEEFLDGLLDNTTAHAIMIPIQKQYFGIGDPIPPNEVDPFAITPTFDQLASDGGYPQQVIRDITPENITFVNNAVTATGGNAGYWRTLALSLQDPGDFAKPDFPSNFAVAGTCLIFGSENLTDLYRIIALLNKLLNMGLRADMAARSQPRPNNLTARVMPIPTEGRIGVQLDWTPVPPALIKPLFSAERTVVTEIFIIRSTDAQLRQWFSWGSVFPEEPSNSPNALPSTSTTKVIARLRNDGFIARYIDDDPDLKIDTPYYYTLALRYRIGDVFQPMSQFSNTVRVFNDRRPGTTRFSEPPDWFATPSLIQLFPILQSINSKIKLFLEGLLSRTASNNGIADMIRQTIQQIGLLLDQANQVANDLKELEDLIRTLANANTAGMYTTTFDVATGGMQAWMGVLASKFSDTTDPTRPPFDNGELTAGFVIVAGAPNLPKLRKFKALLDLLFGNSDSNPFKKALDGFPTTPQPREVIFDANMQPVRIAPEDIPSVINKPVFDTTMTPSESLDDC